MRQCSYQRRTCCGVLKARGALPLLYAGAVFCVFLRLLRKTTGNRAAYNRRTAPPWLCDMLPKLAAGGFNKSNSLKSRPAPCQGGILIANGTLAQAQIPSHMRRRGPQVILWRLLGHPAHLVFGCAHLGRTAPLGIPWLAVYRANGTICALCLVSALLVPLVGAPWCASAPANEALAAESVKPGGALPLLYAGAFFCCFFAHAAQQNADNRARI